MIISGGNPSVFIERGTSVAILAFIAFLLTLPLIKEPVVRASKSALQLISIRRHTERKELRASEESTQKGNDREPVG
jgi:putative tricarboxylic transport membrane protein